LRQLGRTFGRWNGFRQGLCAACQKPGPLRSLLQM
jgi:hypothetical protein